MDTVLRMNRQYRFQRYVYDLTRKYYLLGRDKILHEIPLKDDETLLEVGCGTAHNLCHLADQYSNVALYGVDAADVMLESARRKILKKGYSNIHLAHGLAQQLTPNTLGVEHAFDHILFSYVLSMIPDWESAIEQAISNLKPGGSLHIVDFSDQQQMPTWFRKSLLAWLNWFNVHPDPELSVWLGNLENGRGGKLEIRELLKGYAFIAHYHKNVT